MSKGDLSSADRDCWSYWYPGKVGTIEQEIPKLEELLNQKRVNVKLRILDVGCGTGRHSSYFAKKGFDVYGFDGSQLAIKTANEDLKKEHLEAHLIVHDMTQPFEYQSGYFDAVISTRVIGHAFSDQVRAICREIDRVSRSGGYLYLQVPSREYELKSVKLMEEESGRKVEFVDDMTHIPFAGNERNIPHHHFTREHLLELFPNYKVLIMHEGTEHYQGICFIGEKK